MASRLWDAFLTPQDKLTSATRGDRRFGFGERPALLMIDLYRWVFGDRPQPILCHTDRPPEQSKVILCRRTNGFRSSEPTHFVDSDSSMAALVRIDSDDHHGTCLPPSWVARTGRSAYPNRGDATLLLSQIGRSSGVGRPQKRHNPRRPKNSQSEPADPSQRDIGKTSYRTFHGHHGPSHPARRLVLTSAAPTRRRSTPAPPRCGCRLCGRRPAYRAHAKQG